MAGHDIWQVSTQFFLDQLHLWLVKLINLRQQLSTVYAWDAGMDLLGDVGGVHNPLALARWGTGEGAIFMIKQKYIIKRHNDQSTRGDYSVIIQGKRTNQRPEFLKITSVFTLNKYSYYSHWHPHLHTSPTNNSRQSIVNLENTWRNVE